MANTKTKPDPKSVRDYSMSIEQISKMPDDVFMVAFSEFTHIPCSKKDKKKLAEYFSKSTKTHATNASKRANLSGKQGFEKFKTEFFRKFYKTVKKFPLKKQLYYCLKFIKVFEKKVDTSKLK